MPAIMSPSTTIPVTRPRSTSLPTSSRLAEVPKLQADSFNRLQSSDKTADDAGKRKRLYLRATQALKEQPRLLQAKKTVVEEAPPVRNNAIKRFAKRVFQKNSLRAIPATIIGVYAFVHTLPFIGPLLAAMVGYINALMAYGALGSKAKKKSQSTMTLSEKIFVGETPGHAAGTAPQVPLVNVPKPLVTWAEMISKSDLIKKIYPDAQANTNLLLHGPTGVGKTAGLKMLCLNHGYTFKIFQGSDIKSFLHGGSEKKLHNLFCEARQTAESTKKPVVLLFDEIDTLFVDRSGMGSSGGGGSTSSTGEFLQQLDGAAFNNTNVFIVACTNAPENLDAALKSRFSTSIKIDQPTIEARAHFFKARLAKYQHTLAIEDIANLCVDTEGMSYRELDRTVLYGAALAAASQKREKVTSTDLMDCVKEWNKKMEKPQKPSLLSDLIPGFRLSRYAQASRSA